MRVSKLLGSLVAAALIATPLILVAEETSAAEPSHTASAQKSAQKSADLWVDDMDEFYNRPFYPHPFMQYDSSLRMKEGEKAYVIYVDLPGVAKKDIVMETLNNTVIISAVRKEEEESTTKTMHKSEQSYSSYRQSFTLPSDANMNAVAATNENGVLKITVPKTGKRNAKKIDIK